MSKSHAVKSSYTTSVGNKYVNTTGTAPRMPGKLERVTCPICSKVLLKSDINNCMRCDICSRLYHDNCLQNKRQIQNTCIICGSNEFVTCSTPMRLTDPLNTITEMFEKSKIGGKRKYHKKSKKYIKKIRSRNTRKNRKTRK